MAYTRIGWIRKHTKGYSNLYSYYSYKKKLVLNEEEFDPEDIFEFIIAVLGHAGINLNNEDLKKLADELDVELRDNPLSCEDILKKSMERFVEIETALDENDIEKVRKLLDKRGEKINKLLDKWEEDIRKNDKRRKRELRFGLI